MDDLRVRDLEFRVARLEGALAALGKLARECEDPGPCSMLGRCNGCTYANGLGEPPCEGHTYSGCGTLPAIQP